MNEEILDSDVFKEGLEETENGEEEALLGDDVKEEEEDNEGEYGGEKEENAAENEETEETKMETKTEEEVEVEKEIRPMLSRGKFVFMYGATNSLRTVLIKPFKPEFICDDFRKWLEKAVEYEFKKDRGGDSAAALYFDSNDVGDEAFRCLHEMFASDDVEVYHPPFTSKTACLAHEWFSQLFTFKLEGDYSHRMISLENLPDSVTEMVVKEKFPEAFNIIFYGNDESCKGIATLELPSEEKVDALLHETEEVEIEGEKVPLHKLNTRINKWTKELKLGVFKTVKSDCEREKTARETQSMEDEERVEKCKKYQETMQLKDTVKDRLDLIAGAKIQAHEEFAQEMKFLSLSMMKDTDRRYKETPDVLSFPEPEEVMLPYTKQVISGTANKDQKQEKSKKDKKKSKEEKRKSEDKGSKWSSGGSQKRGNSSRGGPPNKRGNYDDDGWGGRGDRHGKGGKHSRWDDSRDDRSRRNYGGRDRDRGNRYASKMESTIMSLAEKVTQLERYQLNPGGMGNMMGDYGGGYNMGGMQQGGGGYGGSNDGYGGGYGMGGGGGYGGGGGNYNRNKKQYGGKRY